MNPPDLSARRPLKSRDYAFFRWLAARLARARVSPNLVSLAGAVFGAVAGVAMASTSCLEGWPRRCAWVVAATSVQLRLMANLLDGMVAVEGGLAGPTGPLWNEAPDRFADAAILIGAGLAAGSCPLLGFGGALVAVLTAYARALGASLGAGQCFLGPMAKPQRMAVLTGAAVAEALLPGRMLPGGDHAIPVVPAALGLVILGGLITFLRRLRFTANFLRAK